MPPRLVAAALVLAAAPAARADADKLVGTWKEEHEGVTSIWTITKSGTRWTASAEFLEKGTKLIGTATGENPTAAGDSLSFKQVWGKEGKPRRGWLDDATLTLTPAAGGKVKMTWAAGKSRGRLRRGSRPIPGRPPPRPLGRPPSTNSSAPGRKSTTA